MRAQEAPIEVGLSLPNRIRQSEWQTSGTRNKFLVPVSAPKAQSNAFIEPGYPPSWLRVTRSVSRLEHRDAGDVFADDQG